MLHNTFVLPNSVKLRFKDGEIKISYENKSFKLTANERLFLIDSNGLEDVISKLGKIKTGKQFITLGDSLQISYEEQRQNQIFVEMDNYCSERDDTSKELIDKSKPQFPVFYDVINFGNQFRIRLFQIMVFLIRFMG